MPSATTSGADTGSGSAKSRDHNQGNQERKYTSEQKTAVLRVRRCSPTAFYDILDLESVKKTVTDTEIKKAYRKLSLLTHPDKNGHEHADEAFKMVSRAFGVLSDKDKKQKFDRYGGDPDSRFGAGGGGGGSGSSQSAGNPFEGFAQRAQGQRRGNMWEEEISPEEMFNRFFGGGAGFGGPGFVFNMGGGPGMRVHQFGGGRPRMRTQAQRDPNAPPEPPQTLGTMLWSLLPLLILFGLPLLTSLFSGSETAYPSMRFDAAIPPHTLHRLTSQSKTDYYLNPEDVEGYNAYNFGKVDQKAETLYINNLRVGCEREVNERQALVDDASGWFSNDPDKMQRARNMPMRNCRKLEEMGVSRNSY